MKVRYECYLFGADQLRRLCPPPKTLCKTWIGVLFWRWRNGLVIAERRVIDLKTGKHHVFW